MGAWIETRKPSSASPCKEVAPYVGAWIETYCLGNGRDIGYVAPYVGAWIETLRTCSRYFPRLRSHPTWVRGLKHSQCHIADASGVVAPYVGAWIETRYGRMDSFRRLVAPYVGAWIETIWLVRTQLWALSHPTWARGLKPITRKC